MSITEKLAKEIVVTKFEDLPSAAVDRVKRAVMDAVGGAFMGYQVVEKPLVEFAKSVGGIPESTIVGDGAKVSCGLAAGVNAQMTADSDVHETGAGGHAIPSIAHTALAVGERVGTSGRDVITAVALTYELNGRFHNHLREDRPTFHKYAPNMHRHLNLNPAICAAKLLGLNERQVNHCISMAWMFNPPTYDLLLNKSEWPSEYNIWGCQLGVQSALLVQNTSEGPYDILDRDGADIYSLERLIESPSPYHYLLNQLGLKPWLGTYGCMGGIELTKEIIAEQSLKPEDIEKIIFRGGEMYLDHFNSTEPKNYLVTRSFLDYFLGVGCSVPWSLTMAALGYKSPLDWVSEERLKDEAARSMVKRVKIEAAEDYRINEIEIVTRSGTYKKRIMREDFLGGPKRHMSKDQIEGKFLSLVRPVVGDKQAVEMLELFNNLEKLENIRTLTELFRAS